MKTHDAHLARCLRLNTLALAFRLSPHDCRHRAVRVGPALGEAPSTATVAVACAVYGWWGWSLAQAGCGSRAAPSSLLVLSGFWAVSHGASFVFTPLTEYVVDVIHCGSLIFGVWAGVRDLARAARRPSRRRAGTLIPAADNAGKRREAKRSPRLGAG